MPRSPLPRRRSRSVVVRRSARLPISRPRPLVTRYGPVAAHQLAAAAPAQARSGVALPAQRSAPAAAAEQASAVFSPERLVAWALATDDGPPTTVLYPGPPAAWSPGVDEADRAAEEPTAGRASSTGSHRVPGPRFRPGSVG